MTAGKIQLLIRPPYSILAAITVLQMAESQSSSYGHGTATLISDCQKGLRNALSLGPSGTREATQDEYDLIMQNRQRRETLKTKIQTLWVRGHQQMPDRRGEQSRNAEAHLLAVRKLRGEGVNDSITPPIIPKGKASVSFNNQIITAGLPQKIKTNLYYDTLKNKLQKDNRWTDTTFGLIYWEAFHAAMVSVPRTHRISITKISHQLWNTNKQNNKFYNQSVLCPICTNCIEDTNHIYYFTLDLAFRNRLKAQQNLWVELETSNTPCPMIAQLLWCLAEENMGASMSHPDNPSIPSQTMEEQQLIRWSSLLRGFVSKKWSDLYQSYLPLTVKDASMKT